MMRVLVVGGGPGGLAVAIQLSRAGHSVTLFERSATRQSHGFAVVLSESATRCYKESLGLDPLAAGGVEVEGFRHYDHCCELKGEHRTKETVMMHQPGLLKQLHETAVEARVKIREGTMVMTVDLKTTTIHLSDGSTEAGDLIIGADGENSMIRHSFAPPNSTTLSLADPSLSSSISPVHPRLGLIPSGRSAIRFLIPMSTILATPELVPLFSIAWNTTFNQDSAAKVVITYPCAASSQLNVVCLHPAPLSSAYITTTPPATLLQDIYAAFAPPVKALLALAPPTTKVFPLRDLDDLPHWSAHNAVLLGDAAHAVLPTSFSGASMALEDAAVLATLLPADLNPKQLRARLTAYEILRKGRCAKVRDFGRNRVKTPTGFADYLHMLRSGNVLVDARSCVARMESKARRAMFPDYD